MGGEAIQERDIASWVRGLQRLPDVPIVQDVVISHSFEETIARIDRFERVAMASIQNGLLCDPRGSLMRAADPRLGRMGLQVYAESLELRECIRRARDELTLLVTLFKAPGETASDVLSTDPRRGAVTRTTISFHEALVRLGEVVTRMRDGARRVVGPSGGWRGYFEVGSLVAVMTLSAVWAAQSSA